MKPCVPAISGSLFLFFANTFTQEILSTSAIAAIAGDYQYQYKTLAAQIGSRDRAGMAKSAWGGATDKVLDRNMLILPTDRDPTDIITRRTQALIDNLSRQGLARSKTNAFRNRLAALSIARETSGLAKTSGATGFAAIAALRREVALSNPLLDFDSILFVAMRPYGGHMCDQYIAWNVDKSADGGIYILAGIKSSTPRIINVTAKSTIKNGRYAGRGLAGGAFLSPDLSYDGKTILFAWSPVSPAAERCYHIFKVNVDGSNLVQLTDGSAPNTGGNDRKMNQSQNDFDPCWLPNGRIVFISERRGGFGRCHPIPKPTWTMYSMKDDGSDIVCISYHETNEWHPSVNNDGMLCYTRWDYLDRDDCIAHHLWICYPDGRDPRAPHGNYPGPYTTMTGSSWLDGRTMRPNGEWNIRAIPNSQKYIATAAGHHTESFGELVIIDPTIPDDNGMSQVTSVTPVTKNEWAPSGYGDYPTTGYGTAWPLSEDYLICNKNNAIILRDRFGGEEVIYSSSSAINSMRPIDPIPLRPRVKPPVLTTQTWQGERKNLADHKRATISVVNVYQGDMPLPAGVKIRAMRIMQVIPKYTPLINWPAATGYASEALVRLSLGTVPVEDDGSVYCEAPVAKEIYFQLLDERGLAVHSMRAATYVHGGEQMSCAGCHEDKWKAMPPPGTVPLAFRRAPSKPTPDAGAESGGYTPINYSRLVKPTFDSKCVSCHTQRGQGPKDMSYAALEPYSFHFCTDGEVCCGGYLKGDIISPIWGGSRTIPGMFGAYYSRMGKALLNDTHRNAGITEEEFKRVCLWLEGNSMELSVYACDWPWPCPAQLGRFYYPELDFDSTNPTGVESQYPSPQTANVIKRLDLRAPIPRVIDVRGSTVRLGGDLPLESAIRIYDLAGRTCFVRRSVGPTEIDARSVGLARGVYIAKASDLPGRRPVKARFVVR